MKSWRFSKKQCEAAAQLMAVLIERTVTASVAVQELSVRTIENLRAHTT
jgi:hypothetical protein